jgi:hypothetical protein
MIKKDLKALDIDDRRLAQVLLNNNLISDEELVQYLEFRKNRDINGKAFLGNILVGMNSITEKDLEEYLSEEEKRHLDFCDILVSEGYIREEQLEELSTRHKETGTPIILLISEMNLMTKDNFIRLFNNLAYGFKLGEWLLLHGKVTQKKLEAAKEAQRINRLADYLAYHGICSRDTLDKVQEKIASVL